MSKATGALFSGVEAILGGQRRHILAGPGKRESVSLLADQVQESSLDAAIGLLALGLFRV